MVASFASGCLDRILILHETKSRELWTSLFVNVCRCSRVGERCCETWCETEA